MDPLPQVVWVLFAILSPSAAILGIVCKETTNAELPLTPEEPGVPTGLPKDAVPDLIQFLWDLGTAACSPVHQQPQCSRETHTPAVVPWEAQAQPFNINICLSNVNSDPALHSAHTSILFNNLRS